MINWLRHCSNPSRMEGPRDLCRILKRCYLRTMSIAAGILRPVNHHAQSCWNWTWKMSLRIYGDKYSLYVYYWEAQALCREFRECFPREYFVPFAQICVTTWQTR